MPNMMTDIEIYDRAVYAYLSSISSKIVYSPTNTALRIITKREEFNDTKPWSFISYHRSPQFVVNWGMMNNSGTVFGDLVDITGPLDGDRSATYIHNIPVDLTYIVELWSSKAQSVQELAISLISKLYMEDQVMEIPINPNGETGRFHILDIDWTDNSDIENETEKGKIYRHTISFTINARIKRVRNLTTHRMRFCDVPILLYEEYEALEREE